jgi:hypothetical protein
LKPAVVDDFRHHAPGILCTASLSGRQIREAPREAAERQARRLTEMPEVMRWREAGSASSPTPDPRHLEAARHIADKARRTDPESWPGWSTSERIVAPLACNRPEELPTAYTGPEDAWKAWMKTSERPCGRHPALGAARNPRGRERPDRLRRQATRPPPRHQSPGHRGRMRCSARGPTRREGRGRRARRLRGCEASDSGASSVLAVHWHGVSTPISAPTC